LDYQKASADSVYSAISLRDRSDDAVRERKSSNSKDEDVEEEPKSTSVIPPDDQKSIQGRRQNTSP
jgi:hypothetical protein